MKFKQEEDAALPTAQQAKITSAEPARTASHPLVTAVGYAAAIVLPMVVCLITQRVPWLQRTPLALNLALIAGIALFTDFWASLLAAFTSAIAFNYILLEPHYGWSATVMALAHTMIALVCGLIIVLLGQSKRRAETRLQRAMGDMRRKTHALTLAQQGSKSAAWNFTTADRRTYWYEGGYELFGRSLTEITALGSPTSLIFAEDQAKVARAAKLTIETGVPFVAEFRVEWPNGELHWLEARGTPDAADPTLWRGATVDITDRKNAELALVQAEKLAAVGRLASTIAHEINNPLETVTNLLYLGRSDATLKPETRQYLDRADRELTYLASITRRTLSFVRRKDRKGAAEVCAALETICDNYGPRIAQQGGELHCHCEPKTLHLAIPMEELVQVLSNLVSNACDAIQRPGTRIEVVTREETGRAVVLVQDDGTGIPPEHMERIFDPFFTTKADTGTGIGLWVTRQLVESNGGSISVVSGETGRQFKTVFRLVLPIGEPGAVAPAS